MISAPCCTAETYDSSAGIGKHLEKAGEGWAGMAKLGEYAGRARGGRGRLEKKNKKVLLRC